MFLCVLSLENGPITNNVNDNVNYRAKRNLLKYNSTFSWTATVIIVISAESNLLFGSGWVRGFKN